MVEKIKALWIKYEEIIAYLIVGGLTTVVSWAAKFLANFLLFDNTMYPTPFQNVVLSVINWTAGVIFAYFTNRKFVFKSNAPMLSEAPKFVLSRVSTLILDMVVMQVLTAIGVNLLVATLISAVLVIIGNYVFSKLFVFNKKKDGGSRRGKINILTCKSIIKAVRNWQKIENLSVFGLLFVCNLYLELCQISLQQFQRCGNCILVGTLVAVGSVDTGADESVSGINTGA